MGSAILQMGCTIQCPHGGIATVIPSNIRVKVGGGFAILKTDTMIIAGCPFMIGPTPSPCISIQWLNEAKRVKVQGTPVLLESSIGLCKSAANAPQGTAIIQGVQRRVTGL
jgi:hypothetical protein